MTLDSWTPEQVNAMIGMGNEKASQIWEARLPKKFVRPTDTGAVTQFIRDKYVDRRYCPTSSSSSSSSKEQPAEPSKASKSSSSRSGKEESARTSSSVDSPPISNRQTAPESVSSTAKEESSRQRTTTTTANDHKRREEHSRSSRSHSRGDSKSRKEDDSKSDRKHRRKEKSPERILEEVENYPKAASAPAPVTAATVSSNSHDDFFEKLMSTGNVGTTTPASRPNSTALTTTATTATRTAVNQTDSHLDAVMALFDQPDFVFQP
jgi:DNA mismatch repair ATPase MutL